MDILLLVALVIGATVCFLPCVMAWSYYFGGSKKAEKERKPVSIGKTVTTHV